MVEHLTFNQGVPGSIPGRPTISLRFRRLLVGTASLATLIAGCGGGGSSPAAPTSAATRNVQFEYQASTSIDPGVDYFSCTPNQVIFFTHLHFTWNDWEDRRSMVAAGPNLFTYTGEVPTGQELEIALHDPNNCLGGDVYIAPMTLRANGVLLDRVVSVTTGTGVAFRHEADGTITP